MIASTIASSILRSSLEELVNVDTHDELHIFIVKFLHDRINQPIKDEGLLVKEIYETVHSFLFSKDYDSVESLIDALKKFKVTTKHKDPSLKLVMLVDHEGQKQLILRVPNVADKSRDVKDHLAFYIYFASRILCISTDHIKVHMDDELGNVVSLPVQTKQGLERLIATSLSQTGLVGGSNHKVNDYSGPCASYVAALRYLTIYSPFYRPINKKKCCNLQIIKDTIDNDLGLKNPGVTDFTKNFVRQVLATATSHSGALPASFYKVAKTENKVSTLEGILAKLGYYPLVPSIQKVIKLSTISFETDAKGVPMKIIDTPKENVLNRNQEHMMAVKLLLPLITEDKQVSLKDQTKKPLLYLTEPSREFFKAAAEQVKLVNTGYAFVSSYQNKKKNKTNLKHVMNAQGHAARDSDSNLKFQDRTGKVYLKYGDIPISLRNHLENLLRRKSSTKKRKRDTESHNSMETDEAKAESVPGTAVVPFKGKDSSWENPKKKKKSRLKTLDSSVM